MKRYWGKRICFTIQIWRGWKEKEKNIISYAYLRHWVLPINLNRLLNHYSGVYSPKIYIIKIGMTLVLIEPVVLFSKVETPGFAWVGIWKSSYSRQIAFLLCWKVWSKRYLGVMAAVGYLYQSFHFHNLF